MKAIILAAGRGTRVQPITHSIPKPMIPVVNKPVMAFLVELLKQHGFDQIMVNTSYLAPAIESYFGDGRRFGVDISYSFEGYLDDERIVDAPLGSAGALKKIQRHSGFFDEPFIVMCGDAIIDLDLTALMDFHLSRGALATLALAQVPREEVASYGVAVTYPNGRILQFQEKPAVAEALSTTVNTGIYVFDPALLDWIPENGAYDIGSQLFPALVAAGEALYGATLPFQWLDIGRIADYHRVMQMALSGEINGYTPPGREIAPGIRVGLNVRFDPATCNIEGPVYIAGSATVEPGCTLIGPLMVGPGALLESGARVEKSVIFDYTRVGGLANLSGMMVSGKYCADTTGTVIDPRASDIGWVIADARAPRSEPGDYQRLILESLA